MLNILCVNLLIHSCIHFDYHCDFIYKDIMLITEVVIIVEY